MILIRAALVIAFILNACSITAQAQTDEEQAACIDDAQKYCQDEIPDHDKVYACLVKKKSMISVACRRVLNNHPKSQRS